MKQTHTHYTTIFVLSTLTALLFACAHQNQSQKSATQPAVSRYDSFVKDLLTAREGSSLEAIRSIMKNMIAGLIEKESFRIQHGYQGTRIGSRFHVNGYYVRATEETDLFSDPYDQLVISASETGVTWTKDKGTSGIIWVSGKGFMVDHKARIITILGFE